MSELLKTDVGYIIFVYPTSQFYIKTSFNPELCKVRPGFFYDMDSGRYVPKSLITDVPMTICTEEPIHLKVHSDFWKSLLLEDVDINA